MYPSRNLIRREEEEHPVEPKIMDVLCFLAARPGEVVTRAALLDAVWGRSFGADESLTRAISRLRKVFGDARATAAVLETVPKRGYRLCARVAVLEEATSERESSPAGVAATRVRGSNVRVFVAVLCAGIVVAIIVGWNHIRHSGASPSGLQQGFEVSVRNMEASDATQEDRQFALRVADQLAVSLARTSLMHVRRVHPPFAAASGFAIQGSVERFGAMRRVTVGLVDAANDEAIWSGTFVAPAPRDAASQDSLVRGITAEMKDQLLKAAKVQIRRKPLASLRPWELTLLATWVPGSDEVFLHPHAADALSPQRRAIQLDPKYAPAHASLASALSYIALFDPRQDGSTLRSEAAQHAEAAAALAPYDADVLYGLATYHRQIGEREAALRALQRVLALQPDHPTAHYDLVFDQGLCTGGSAAALDALNRDLGNLAVGDPVRWVVLSHLADLYLGIGDYPAAIEAARSSRQIVRSTWSGITLAAALAALHREQEALLVSRETKLEWPDLDWDRFSREALPRWCLGGDATKPTMAFDRLASVEAKLRSRSPSRHRLTS